MKQSLASFLFLDEDPRVRRLEGNHHFPKIRALVRPSPSLQSQLQLLGALPCLRNGAKIWCADRDGPDNVGLRHMRLGPHASFRKAFLGTASVWATPVMEPSSAQMNMLVYPHHNRAHACQTFRVLLHAIIFSLHVPATPEHGGTERYTTAMFSIAPEGRHCFTNNAMNARPEQ
jgi:hypothetical protein